MDTPQIPGPGQTPGTVGDVHVALSADLRAPGEARSAVRATLATWRLPALVDAVCLAVSELVTNAVRHGLPPVRMVLSRGARHVRVEVHDEAPGEPKAKAVRGEAQSGRGLAIVAALAQTSGVEQVEHDGKNVYATFEAPPLGA